MLTAGKSGPQYLHAPILLLREGTDDSQGLAQVKSNIAACEAVVNFVRSTLGPRGMDKLIVNSSGAATITNDGATVVDLLDVSHPAARILAGIAKAQDGAVGDGTTSVVVLAGALLQGAKELIEEGLPPQVCARGFQLANQMAFTRLEEVTMKLSSADAEKRAMLEKCAATTLHSKLLSGCREHFARMVVDAVSRLDPAKLQRNMVGIKKVPGGSVMDSQLVDGVAFKKTFAYAGHEQQPKQFKRPKVLLLNVELELKAEKENAEVRVTNSEEYERVVDAEWRILTNKLQAAVDCGAQVVLSRLPIGDLATQFFAEHGVFAAGRVEEGDLARTAAATGARVQTTMGSLSSDVLGGCEEFEEMQIGSSRFNFFRNGHAGKAVTLVLRGGAQQFIDEAERSLHDAIEVVRRAMQTNGVVGGAGSIEMLLSRYLRDKAREQSGRQQLAINKFAAALECIPHTLAANSGLDPISILNQLRRAHAEAAADKPCWMGVGCVTGGVIDAMEHAVVEPWLVKSHALAAATEAAATILTIDETIKNAKSNPDPIPQGARGMRRG